MRFLIQGENGLPEFDFGFELVQAVKLLNLMYPEQRYIYEITNELSSDSSYEDWIPVGSLEFVYNFMDLHYGISKKYIKPINIPQQLMLPKFLGRKIEIVKANEITLKQPFFVKSNEQYKGYAAFNTPISEFPTDEELLASEELFIKSEFRIFVQNRMVAGVKQYAGDLFDIPDEKVINEMLDAYTDCPTAFTLDIATTDEGTFLMEVHPFVSCGLYGFKRHNLLPSMFYQGFHYMLREAKKLKELDSIGLE